MIMKAVKTPQGYSDESSIYDDSQKYLCGVFCSVALLILHADAGEDISPE